MLNLSPTDAVTLVRKNLEELDPNGSIMYNDDGGSNSQYGDNASMDSLIKRNLPEAINAVHLSAPAQLLEGEQHVFSDPSDVVISLDGVMSISLGENANLLRLVSFQAADCPIVVTDLLSEASAEGRKQLNTYIRGDVTRPRIVLTHGTHDAPVLKYYTLSSVNNYVVTDDNDAHHGETLPLVPETPPENYQWSPAAISQLSYIKEQTFSEQAAGYPVSRMLRQNIIDYLTAMVLEVFGNQRAEYFYKKAQAY